MKQSENFVTKLQICFYISTAYQFKFKLLALQDSKDFKIKQLYLICKMKPVAILLFLSLQFGLYGQTKNDTIPSGEFYLITEAYFIKNNSTFNINKDFIARPTGIALIPFNDSVIISIDHGGIDQVLHLGYGKKITNPGFEVSRNDSEFYLWKYIEPNVSEKQNAFILKECVTGSFEQRGVKYFYFNIQFKDRSQYQFYASVIQYNPAIKKPK